MKLINFQNLSLSLATLAFFLTCSVPTVTYSAEKEVAVFAGGCFWCMQPPFDKLKDKGVISTVVGYSGGTKENPTYEETSSGTTGHRESIEVTFDPQKISYKELLKVFWKNIDPYDSQGQFCDKGEQYTSAVFYLSEAQKNDLEASLKDLVQDGITKAKIATTMLPFKKFYPAEAYHQSYYEKNPIRYKVYRYRCGRDKRLKEVWGSSARE
ncbi:MAG: peptide-methionine (S)-S-oxide reductase [Bdellovibrionales bacterium GWA2_49_15]|nr:MAG: peptide-methionine (S)-S-oxide reductase [Bdellovibrionales bacterium GWA2_49_15]HAZ14265.1 peptide-methionine (S)-S-oxide reductase [Bdellovibrionales bacterium]